MLYESTKHGTNESSRHHPQKGQMNFLIFPWVLLKLSVKGLLRYSVKCFGWKTSAVARSSSSFKLRRKSSRWSSSFTKFPTGFQIPAASNEQFVFQLGSLSTRVLETRTATGREHFAYQGSNVSWIFILIISNGEKILSNVNVVV